MDRPDFTEESIKGRKYIYRYMNGGFLLSPSPLAGEGWDEG
jgi:hypothetical protein